jgi:hypothetical protein
MALSYPIVFPTGVAIRDIRWHAISKVAQSESPFTGEQQVVAHEGTWFEIEIQLPPMTRAQAEDFVGFLLAMRGRFGTFTLGDPDGGTPQGTATGTPLVNGASQTGTTLITDGWDISQASLLKRGDWIQIGSYAYKITQDASSDGSGNATLEIFPALRASPANNAAITTTNTTSLWRLSSNDTLWSVDDLVHYGITITAREAL